LKLPYLRASYTKSVGPIKFCIEIYLPRLLFFKTLRRLGAIFETTCIFEGFSKISIFNGFFYGFKGFLNYISDLKRVQNSEIQFLLFFHFHMVI
jgi:hypothetical protein